MRTVNVKSASDGTYSTDIAHRGKLEAVKVEIGDLSTPDLEITDEPTGTNLLTVAAIAGDAIYYPQVATTDPADGTAGDDFTSPGVFGKLHIAISGAGNAKSGVIRLLLS
jgi:hypothetical protein